MKAVFFSLFSMIFLAASCRKEIPVAESPAVVDKNKPMLLWKRSLSDGQQRASSFDPVIFNDQVIYSCQDCGEQYPILNLEGSTGEKIMQWQNWQSTPEPLWSGEHRVLIDDNLIVASGRECVSINLNTMSTNWNLVKQNQTANTMQIYSDSKSAFWTARFNFNNIGTTSQACILKLNPQILSVDTLYKMTTTDGYRPWFSGLSFYTLNNGNEIVIAKNRSANPSLPWQTAERMDVFAYNITADTLLWYHKGVEVNNWGGILPIRTYQGLAVVPGHKYIHCFDIATGVKVWEYQVDENLTLGDVVIHKGNVLHKDDNNSLTSLSLATGSFQWKENNVGSCKGRVAIYNDKLFYCGGYFRVVDANTGTLIYTSQGADWDNAGPISMTPALDTVNRRVFINNSSFAIGLQMPENW